MPVGRGASAGQGRAPRPRRVSTSPRLMPRSPALPLPATWPAVGPPASDAGSLGTRPLPREREEPGGEQATGSGSPRTGGDGTSPGMGVRTGALLPGQGLVRASPGARRGPLPRAREGGQRHGVGPAVHGGGRRGWRVREAGHAEGSGHAFSRAAGSGGEGSVGSAPGIPTEKAAWEATGCGGVNGEGGGCPPRSEPVSGTVGHPKSLPDPEIPEEACVEPEALAPRGGHRRGPCGWASGSGDKGCSVWVGGTWIPSWGCNVAAGGPGCWGAPRPGAQEPESCQGRRCRGRSPGPQAGSARGSPAIAREPSRLHVGP